MFTYMTELDSVVLSLKSKRNVVLYEMMALLDFETIFINKVGDGQRIPMNHRRYLLSY